MKSLVAPALAMVLLIALVACGGNVSEDDIEATVQARVEATISPTSKSPPPSNGGQSPSPTLSPTSTPIPSPTPTLVESVLGKLTVGVVSKRASVQNNVDEIVEFTLVLGNTSDLDVRAFTGRLIFADLFGREFNQIRFTFDDPLPAQQAITESGYFFDTNQFDEDDEKLRNSDLANLQVSWVTDSVILMDGTQIGEAR